MTIKEYLEKNPMGSPYLKYAKSEYSQNGEDGIISKILEELEIEKGTLVEFGAWDGIYLSNIYNLWKDGKFKAILIEGDSDKKYWFNRKTENVEIYNVYVSPDSSHENSIERILDRSGHPASGEELVLMSIDIDTSDYFIMQSLQRYKPIIIVIETCINFPLGSNFKSYDKGCSFDAVWELGKQMGYSIVAYTSNAILVRSDYLHKLKEFNPDATMEDIYINHDQYQVLGKVDNKGEVLSHDFCYSEPYKKNIEMEKNR